MKKVALALVVALATASLVSCASSTEPMSGVNIVASTNVYGSIAEAVAGPHANVTSIIDNPSQDPHSFEAGPRVQLALSRADVVIVNGGGYDDFANTLLSGSSNANVHVITAVEASGLSTREISENEHVWYDFSTASGVAVALAEKLSEIDPEHATDYRKNAREFNDDLTALTARLAEFAISHPLSTVMVTEPVPLYLVAAAGLTNVTPPELSTAMENGNGVPPAVMNSALTLLRSGTVSLLVFNEQTEGPETRQLRSAAAEHGIPSFGVTETIPDGLSYIEWMTENIQLLEKAFA